MSLLSSIKTPQDLKKYTTTELYFIAEDIRKKKGHNAGRKRHCRDKTRSFRTKGDNPDV